MALIWPRFSATSTIATGAISSMALSSKVGAVNAGSPNQLAAATLEKSIGLPSPITLVPR
ncbi:hypothetical protein D3C87_1987520 [compost metagenome]